MHTDINNDILACTRMVYGDAYLSSSWLWAHTLYFGRRMRKCYCRPPIISARIIPSALGFGSLARPFHTPISRFGISSHPSFFSLSLLRYKVIRHYLWTADLWLSLPGVVICQANRPDLEDDLRSSYRLELPCMYTRDALHYTTS